MNIWLLIINNISIIIAFCIGYSMRKIPTAPSVIERVIEQVAPNRKIYDDDGRKPFDL